jgi:hypothetical protein
MSEISLCFTQQSNDCTDLVSLMDGLGHSCPNLRNLHISSIQLSNEAVSALESANLRYTSTPPRSQHNLMGSELYYSCLVIRNLAL